MQRMRMGGASLSGERNQVHSVPAAPRSPFHFFFIFLIQQPLLEVIIVLRARLMLLLHGPLEYVFTGASGKSSSDSRAVKMHSDICVLSCFKKAGCRPPLCSLTWRVSFSDSRAGFGLTSLRVASHSACW